MGPKVVPGHPAVPEESQAPAWEPELLKGAAEGGCMQLWIPTVILESLRTSWE